MSKYVQFSNLSNADQVIAKVRESTIGEGITIEGPFGAKRLIYADFTASGRSVSFIEDFINDQVLPLYGNAHSEATTTARHTNELYEEARSLVHSSVRGGDEDVVIFCGSGMTGAMDKLIGILQLRIPHDMDLKYKLSDHIPKSERPVVFIGPYEHHSNELPWRESIAEVVVIPEKDNGTLDTDALEAKLKQYVKRPLKIGSFSAASNVTGIISDTVKISDILHRHGAYAVWDYAAAAPHLQMDMHPEYLSGNPPLSYKDVILFSPHKFPGGPGTPGVLIINKNLLANTVPVVPGGGTVLYVNDKEHSYNDDAAAREEGGTPPLVGAIRCGLVMQLKEKIGVAAMERYENIYLNRALQSWMKNPSIIILGDVEVPRLAIVSLIVKPVSLQTNQILHHNFVVAVLNDVFGIQCRGGCSCAAPYGHRLLKIDMEYSHSVERQVLSGLSGIKPGWVRVSLSYLMTSRVVDYIIEAVNLVAEWGWLLLPEYKFDEVSGRWQHNNEPELPVKLKDLDMFGNKNSYNTEPETIILEHMEQAQRLFDSLKRKHGRKGIEEDADLIADTIGDDFQRLRKFALPAECVI